MYIVTSDYMIGKIKNICTCDKCRQRGEFEIFIDDLDDNYLDCVSISDLYGKIVYFGDSLVDAVNTIIMDKSRVIKENEFLKYINNYLTKRLIK